jgi:hypothetical protein
VWVVYFSLAALPLFGLGQALIPAEDDGRRRYAMWLLTLYVASGLGLLLTTRLLGLRRYLRQRRVQMPGDLTASWLYLGGGLIVALLVVGVVLPRPQAEYALFNLKPASSQSREASQHALRSDKAGEGEGKPEGEARPEAQKGSGAEGKDSKNGDQGGGKQGKSQGQDGKDKGGKSQNQGRGQSAQNNSISSRLLQSLGSVAPVLKWIVFGLVALAALVVVFRSGLQFLAQFLQWARSLLAAFDGLWAALFGKSTAPGPSRPAQPEVEPREEPRPFAGYPDPFLTGAADGMSGRQLLAYTLAALEAWANERGVPRMADETALEFAGRLGEEVPALETDLRRLASVHGRVMYAPSELAPAGREVIRQFWQHLTETASRGQRAGMAMNASVE